VQGLVVFAMGDVMEEVKRPTPRLLGPMVFNEGHPFVQIHLRPGLVTEPAVVAVKCLPLGRIELRQLDLRVELRVLDDRISEQHSTALKVVAVTAFGSLLFGRDPVDVDHVLEERAIQHRCLRPVSVGGQTDGGGGGVEAARKEREDQAIRDLLHGTPWPIIKQPPGVGKEALTALDLRPKPLPNIPG
jgi:hypothetical protein